LCWDGGNGRVRRVMRIVIKGDLKEVKTQTRRCWFLKCNFNPPSVPPSRNLWNLGLYATGHGATAERCCDKSEISGWWL